MCPGTDPRDKLEAPPGFEPGMEVLQDCTGPLLPSKFDDFLNRFVLVTFPVVPWRAPKQVADR